MKSALNFVGSSSRKIHIGGFGKVLCILPVD